MLRKKYFDATHNCYAYRIGLEAAEEFRYSDDGEPSGTAGRPIYDAILSRELTDVLVVVTRYFGGIKLGTGGLGRAYREAAIGVLANASVIEKYLMKRLRLDFSHDLVSIVMKVLSEYHLKPEQTEYGETVELTTSMRLSLGEKFTRELFDRCHGRIKIEEL